MAAIPIPITGLAGRKSLGIGVLCGLAVALIWSGWSVATRFAVTTSLGPYDVTFLRFGVSALLLWPILVRKGLGIEQIGIVRLLVMVLGAGVPFMLLGSIGTDVNSGLARFTWDAPFLADGVGIVSIALGCFGIAEIAKNLDSREERSPFNGKIKLMPTWPEFKRIIPSALRGSVVGSILGILPGGGPVIAQFAAYALDKKVSKYSHEIGTGCIEGVAGQAAADEAAARTSFIPLMSIGIPENAVMALMMAAFIIKGIQPGPNMIAGHPELFWGLVASMWIGNCFLLVLNVPLVRYWLSVFKIPYNVLFPAILFFCCIGTYSINNSLDDVFITVAFGALGYLFMRLEMDPSPLMLGFILGPMLEENFRRSMLLSRGSFEVFINRPISGTLISLIAAFILWQTVSFFRQRGKAKELAVAEPVAS